LDFQKYNIKEKEKKVTKIIKKKYIYGVCFKKCGLSFFFFYKVIVGYKNEN